MTTTRYNDTVVTGFAGDGSISEVPLSLPPVTGSITGIHVTSNIAVTASDTDYVTVVTNVRDLLGGAAATVTSKTTKVTGGAALVAWVPMSEGAISNGTLTSAQQLSLIVTAGGAGKALSALTVRVTYDVADSADVATERLKTIIMFLSVLAGNIRPSTVQLALRGNGDAIQALYDGIAHTHGGTISPTALSACQAAISAGIDAARASPAWLMGAPYLASTLDNV